MAGPAASADSSTSTDVPAMLARNACTACHGTTQKIVGPAFREVAARHSARADVVDYLAGRIRSGGQGEWGTILMPAQSLTDDDARSIAKWIANGAK
jgi:cytochrome c